MKLLYVTAGLPFARGETFIIPEIMELRRRGHDVTLSPVRPYQAVLHGDATPLLPFTASRPVISARVLLAALGEAARRPLRTAAAFLALRHSRSLKILLKNIAVFPKGMWLARLARRRGIEHIHVHWASTSATAAYVAARVSGITWSLTAHRWDIAENNLVREKARTASFLRAIDVQGGEELRGHMGEHGDKLVVVHMGVELPAFPERRARPLDGVMRLVMAAFFVEKKGHRYALEAVAQLRDRGINIELDMAGDGPIRAEVERIVADLRLSDRVRFLGMLGHAELLDGLARGRWDVAILPSIVTADGEKEGIPVFLMEAAAAGVPVVSTDTGGIPELLCDSGIMVPQRDAGAIADALERLFKDDELRAQVGAASQRAVNQGFSVAASVDQLVPRFAASCKEADTASTGS